MELRDYQKEIITELWQWFGKYRGNPCIVAPTGAGKSVLIAEIFKESIKAWPSTRCLMLTHQKELITQDYEKLLQLWPQAPVAIYSAGIGRRDTAQITYAGIQSIYNHSELLRTIDLVIVDEAHLINHEDTGRYRKLIDTLRRRQPNMKVIGMTATPYRLGHGMITDYPAIFSAPLIEPVTIIDLIEMGYLSILRSKATKTVLDVSHVKKSGGEYVEKDLQEAVDVELTNEQVVDETLSRAADRHHILFFCAGVQHAEHIRDILTGKGVMADCVTGKTPKKQREQIINDFKSGQIRCLTNANILTTGFDYPGIDCIAMLRPTCSPGLMVQMVGRGLRIAPGKKDCLVLDFAGNIAKHGAITHILPPAPKGEGKGTPPCKECPQCMEILPINMMVCPACGYEFPKPQEKDLHLALHNDDVLGLEPNEMPVQSWQWYIKPSKRTGIDMLVCNYYGGPHGVDIIREYYCIWNEGWAGRKAIGELRKTCLGCNVDYEACKTSEQLLEALNNAHSPSSVSWIPEGDKNQYKRIVKKNWTKPAEPEEKESDYGSETALFF